MSNAVALLASAYLSLARLDAADGGALLKAGTLAAWATYERQVDERYQAATAGRFFARDAFSAGDGWRKAATDGGIALLPIHSARPGGPEPDVPEGRIHHWVGAIFVPRTTVDAVLTYLLSHAGQEAGAYDDVIASKLLSRDGPRLRVFMKLRRTKIITATYNTEHLVEYRRIGTDRASGRSVATRIAELEDAGTASERERPPGDDSGYLWRLNAYWRYEQTSGGVLIECESVSLSRSVPVLLRPLISGIVEGVAHDSLERTLTSLRRALAGAP